ncbi:S-adenosyl-L-methionine-dependent methyltransferase [Periconia macrospinosa]|uniref:S-adenosyl-L-methionine-dependent methyltransferase n=1 Tax=Periconia macrospinosa TaxID=97972 RepID=A0A2V1DU57_9PLEO|nr:S-adenosyl-L-methionine-dependent methyltransferase [Periconia macrospinosa]
MPDTIELARGYALVNDTQYDAGMFLLQRLEVAQGMKVLDVGCGLGNLSNYIADLVKLDGSVIGIDPSKERVAIALEKRKPNTSFYVGVAEDLSRFPTASFDIVYVNSTLHWVRDQPTAIKEFARVLKSGGRLGVSGGSGDYLTAQEKIKEAVLSKEPYCRYPEESPPKFLKQSELIALLDSAGFSERSIVVNKIVKSTKDADAMIEWLDTSSSGKTYGSMPMNLRPRAREEMKVEWNKLLTPDGIHMEMELLVTVAVKA